MEKGQRTSPLFLVPSIALIVILVGNTFRHVTPESIRPPGKPSTIQEDEKVACRLWQDPYEVALDHYNKNKQSSDSKALENSKTQPQDQQVSDSYTLKTDDNTIQDRLSSDQNSFHAIQQAVTQHTKVMFVMMRHRFTAEDCERRLRTRYAVLSAVNDSGYAPVNTENIQYIRYQTEQTSANDGKVNPIILPYEWYKYDPVNRLEKDQVIEDRRLLIMWLPEYGFQDDPILRLGNIIEQILENGNNSPEFIFIGPTSSDVQFAIFKKVIKDKVTETTPNDYRLAIYSPWSTADPNRLQESFASKNEHTDITQYHWKATVDIKGMDTKNIELDFRRMIGMDDLLAKALIDELKDFRNIDPTNPNDHIVLISEWDTRYGKLFPETFKEEVKRTDKNSSFSNIHVYQYMRGLDGRVFDSTQNSSRDDMNNQNTEQSDASSENALDYKKWIKTLKKPLGQSQIDYVERFVQDLTEQHECIKAIGVVGSDVYDKILLLQALRQEFPQALYFTIDLDTRLIHPECFEHTRNLIVASHYGLSLNEEYLQGGEAMGKFMQFRDNYQTSVFFACRSALSGNIDDAPLNEIKYISSFNDINRLCSSALKKLLSSPRVFEIGRNCAVDFSLEMGSMSDTSSKSNISGIHPSRLSSNGSDSNNNYVVAALWIATDIGILIYIIRSLQRWWTKCVKVIYFVIINIVIVWFAMAVKSSNVAGEEPFSLFSGISSWPNLSIRMIANLLAVWLIIKGWDQLRKSKYEIEKSLCIPISIGYFEELRKLMYKWTYIFHYYIGLVMKGLRRDIPIQCPKNRYQHPLKNVQMNKLWQEYQFCGHFFMRFLRSFLWILIIVVIFMCKEKSTVENSFFLYRGHIVQGVRETLKWPSIYLGFFVIIFAGDAVWLCLRLISKISNQKIHFTRLYEEKYPKLKEVKGLLYKMKRHNKKDCREIMSQLFIIRIIACETKAVRTLLYYPFVICFVMLVSLHSFFDNFTFPLWVAVTAVVYLGFAIVCSCALRVEAEKMRRRILNRLEDKLIYYKSRGSDGESMVKMIETTLAKIKEVTQGAFSPMIKDGYFGTLLLPTSGYSIYRIVEYYLTT